MIVSQTSRVWRGIARTQHIVKINKGAIMLYNLFTNIQRYACIKHRKRSTYNTICMILIFFSMHAFWVYGTVWRHIVIGVRTCYFSILYTIQKWTIYTKISSWNRIYSWKISFLPLPQRNLSIGPFLFLKGRYL